MGKKELAGEEREKVTSTGSVQRPGARSKSSICRTAVVIQQLFLYTLNPKKKKNDN